MNSRYTSIRMASHCHKDIYLLCIILASEYFKFTCFKCFYHCVLDCLVLWIPRRLRTFSALSSVCPLCLWCLFSKASFTLPTLKCFVSVPTLLYYNICKKNHALSFQLKDWFKTDFCVLICQDENDLNDNALLKNALQTSTVLLTQQCVGRSQRTWSKMETDITQINIIPLFSCWSCVKVVWECM